MADPPLRIIRNGTPQKTGYPIDRPSRCDAACRQPSSPIISPGNASVSGSSAGMFARISLRLCISFEKSGKSMVSSYTVALGSLMTWFRLFACGLGGGPAHEAIARARLEAATSMEVSGLSLLVTRGFPRYSLQFLLALTRLSHKFPQNRGIWQFFGAKSFVLVQNL